MSKRGGATAELTAKQKAFINHYILTLNGTESARLAGYAGTESSLAVIAHSNLRKVKIRGEIDRRLRELTVTADETLARISVHATTSLDDFLTFEGDTPKIDLTKAKRLGRLSAVKKYKETETRVTNKFGREVVTVNREIELYPSDSAHDKLMRYHSLYNDKLKIEGWQRELLDLIQSGRLTREEVRKELGDELANEFFETVGVRK